jgi:ribonuclease P protein component
LIGRVRYRSEFARLRRHGVRASCGPLTVSFAPDEPWPGEVAGAGSVPGTSRTDAPLVPAGTAVAERSPGPSVRLATATPRRIGNAVVRNRLRRRLRGIFAAEAPLPAGIYLVSLRPGAADLSFDELSEHVHRALTEIARRTADRRARRRHGRGTTGRGERPA